MRNRLTGLLLLWASASSVLGAEDRACNQLGRESALRISEQTQLGMSSEQRRNVAAIVEQACLEYSDSGAGLMDSQAQNPTAANASGGEATAEETSQAEEEEGGFFNLRIIDPEDRVQRPGLKRR